MKKLFVTLAIATLAVGAYAQGTLGSVTLQNTLGVGKEKFIYGPDPSNPTVAKSGGQLGDYATFAKVEGASYLAELWYGAGAAATEDSLRAVAGSQVGLRSAGIIAGKRVDIAGTHGGDTVTLQLRVWNSEGGKYASWDSAVEKGKSNLFSQQLGGANVDNVPFLPINTANGLTYFSLAVPEPSAIALGALGLGALLLRRRK